MVRNDMNTLMDTMFLLFTYFGSIYKQIIMLVKAKQVQELLNTMKGDLFNQPEEKHHELLKDTAREAKILVNIYSSTSVVTCFLMALYLHILYSQGTHVEFSIWFPFEPDTKPKFYFALFYYYIQITWIAFNITTLDAFITFFLHQCTTQMNILRYDLENFVESCKIKSTNSKIPLSQAYDMKFKNMALHFLEIHKFFAKVEATYSGAIFCQFLFGAWILCTTAYRFVEIDKTSLACFTIILFLMCIFAELFLFCFYGSKLTDASEKLMDSAYFLDWVEIPIKHKKDLMLFMEMIKKPIMPTAGSIAPLANTTFVSIVKSSYSFYAFLKNSES
ncbi:PREDICTED: odorant receptor 94b-like [Papilio xuthus]|uniref:Odorant receptor 94b-like n=1 Tax=Papilio xuthus TaxID=66420 RepID=A0AAJ6ZJB4_PAPXU|nr:PREDICTED: odorant receptor 94b-like [Papilio xuthus]